MNTSKLLDGAVERRFHELVTAWKSSRGVSSSLSEMFAHPAYRELIAIGEPVIPLLLGELEREADWWFAALKARRIEAWLSYL